MALLFNFHLCIISRFCQRFIHTLQHARPASVYCGHFALEIEHVFFVFTGSVSLYQASYVGHGTTLALNRR